MFDLELPLTGGPVSAETWALLDGHQFCGSGSPGCYPTFAALPFSDDIGCWDTTVLLPPNFRVGVLLADLTRCSFLEQERTISMRLLLWYLMSNRSSLLWYNLKTKSNIMSYLFSFSTCLCDKCYFNKENYNILSPRSWQWSSKSATFYWICESIDTRSIAMSYLWLKWHSDYYDFYLLAL